MKAEERRPKTGAGRSQRLGMLHSKASRKSSAEVLQLKRIPPGIGSKAAIRDPIVELDVSGRRLTSEGLLEFAPALLKSMEHNNENGKIVRLEELCLRESHIDSRSLLHLARIISLASYDLRDLDLSENQITVTTHEEVAAWGAFLNAFSNCCVLRRIDLSGNLLGPRAFEVLARVYANENPIDLVLSDSVEESLENSTRSLRSASQGGDELAKQVRRLGIATNMERGQRRIESVAVDQAEPRSSLSHAEPLDIYVTTKGVRSVPYLILSNTGMKEACALHLSYVIGSHNMPEKLLTRVPATKAGPHTQQLLAYDSETRCRGIVYLPNSHLGGAAMKVLELAEAVREGLCEDLDLDDEEGFRDVLHKPKSAESGRKISDPASKHGNKICISVELDRARSRIQGNVLQEFGPGSNDLWRTALKMLTLCRVIHPVQEKKKASIVSKRPEIMPDVASRTHRTRLSVSTPLSTRNPNQHIANPFAGQWRLDNARLVPVMAPVKPSLATPCKSLPAPPNSAPCVNPPATTVSTPYRTKLPYGLPDDVWLRIMAAAAGADVILSVAQQRSVIRWAMDRNSLNKEKEFLGLKGSAQIWKVLEGMGCLAYEMRN